MDEQKKPRSRVKKVVNDGKGVEVHGEGLGTGPLNNTGNYADRKQQGTQGPGRQLPFIPASGNTRPEANNPFGPNRGQSQNPFATGRSQSKNPFGQSRPHPYQTSGQSGKQTAGKGGQEQRQYHSAVKQNGTQNTHRSTGTGRCMT